MQTIKLTQNQVTLVDDCDYIFLTQWKWHAIKGCHTFYAVRGIWHPEIQNNKNIGMHTVIMQRQGFKGLKIDHKDGNGLNNQRINLRETTQQGNAANAPLCKTNTSGYKGVYWNTSAKKWQAYICVNDKSKYLGVFTRPQEAAHAYNVAAMKYFGEFARLNPVD